jgi:hypothetical protein
MGDPAICQCHCHTGPYAACDMPGGCGLQHRAGPPTAPAEGTPGGCTTCAVYRPDRTPRLPYRPPVCDGDRTLLDRHHVDIGRLVAALAEDHDDIADRRLYQRFGIHYREVENPGDRRVVVREVVSLGLAWADPVGALGGVAPINSKPKTPKTTGSREAPIPIRVNVIDLAGPPRVPSLTDAARPWLDDQDGFLSAATVLDLVCRDVRDTLFPDQHLPGGSVDAMVGWLRNRLDDVCDRHPAVAELASQIKDLRGALRAVADESDPPPERCDGIPCQRCDLLTLFRQPDGDVECVNVDCRAVYRPDEYDAWVKQYAASNGVKRHARSNA